MFRVGHPHVKPEFLKIGATGAALIGKPRWAHVTAAGKNPRQLPFAVAQGTRGAILRQTREITDKFDVVMKVAFALYEVLVRAAGVEPALCRQNWILSPARLPVPPRPREVVFAL
jgi:hypothetical protein